jgi:tetratricopeptide (TPR) repeat protein
MVIRCLRRLIVIYRYKYAFFIDGSSKQSIEVDIINSVQGQRTDHSPITFEDALYFFCNEHNKEWILIYDSVDDVSMKMSNYLPKCRHGSVIITTRNQILGELASRKEFHIKLGPMSDAEAIASIYKSADMEESEQNKTSVTSIATELGNLPVALIQAGSYILRTMCTPDEYLRKLQSHKAELMKKSTGGREDQSAYATFELSYQRLPSPTRTILHILSHLHCNDFPLKVITQAAIHRFRLRPFSFCEEVEEFEQSVQLLLDTFCLDKATIELTLDSIVTTLQNYSLATFYRNSTGLFLRIHPLNHLWSRHVQSPHERSMYRTAAVRLIVSTSPSKQLHAYLIPHIRDLIAETTIRDISLNDLAVFGVILMRTQRVEDAQAIWQKICQALIFRDGICGTFDGVGIVMKSRTTSCDTAFLNECKLKFNLKRLDTLRALANYATTHHLKGSYEIARKLQNHVVGEMNSQLGEDNEETLKAKGELGLTYQMQQRYSEAKALQEDVLRRSKLLLGDDHFDVLGTMANLAITDRSLGNYAGAQELQEKILEKKKMQLGEDHWETLKSMINLAKTLHVQGKHASAMELQEKVRDAREMLLGKAHLKTLEAMAHLATTYRSRGNYAAAEEAQMYVLDQRKLQLGESHLSTLEAMEQLGLTFHSQGHYTIAEQVQKQIVEERTRRLGESHPDTLRAMTNLAITFRSEEMYLNALSIQKRVMEMRQQSLGNSHTETLEAMTNLSITYGQSGVYDISSRLQRTVLEEKLKKWGADHPEILKARLNLAESYRCMGRNEDAIELQKQVVEARSKQLGRNHLDTLDATSCLAITYRSQGNYILAAMLQAQILEERSKQLEEDHPSVHRAMVNLAKTRTLEGSYELAESLLRRVFDWRVKKFGMTHLDTISSLEDLQALYEVQADFINAMELVNNMLKKLEEENESRPKQKDTPFWERRFKRLAIEFFVHKTTYDVWPVHLLERVSYPYLSPKQFLNLQV